MTSDKGYYLIILYHQKYKQDSLAYLRIRTEIRSLEGAGFVRCNADEFELHTSFRLKEI